uniref:Uncharacterized protein n=1 Tax=viral metagenome TaxID=1070528 RepID=A0A6C0D965_9ZZZZ
MASEDKPMVMLEPDEDIRGQAFVCLSFLTPNRGLLKQKEHYFFSEFLKFYALDYKIKATESFVLGQFREIQNALADATLAIANMDLSDSETVAAKKKETVAALDKVRGALAQRSSEDLQNHVKTNMADFRETTITEEYQKWFTAQHERLEDDFHKQQNFQTTMHGLKVRGVYPSEDMAKAKAKALHKKDPYFNVFVAPVGQWLPWDPHPDDVAESEYQNDDLNNLMKAYRENEERREEFFEEEKRRKVQEANDAAKAAKAEKAAQKSAAAAAPANASTVPASATASIFGNDDDLFLRRRQEKNSASS